MEFGLTEHFRERTQARGLKAEILDFILVWGTAVHAAGACHLVVLRRDLPKDVRSDPRVEQATQWVIVMSCDGTCLATCFRNDEAHKFVKAKPKDFQDAARRRRKTNMAKRRRNAMTSKP